MVSKPSISISSISNSMVSKPSISISSISKPSIRETSMISSMSDDWRVVDERSGRGQYSGGSSQDGRVSLSLTLLPLSSSSGGSFMSSSMSSLSLGNLGGVNNGLRGNTSVHRSNWKLWVVCGSNWEVFWGKNWSNWEVGVEDRKTRIGNAESGSVSNILNLLELSIGIDIRVSS